MSTGLFSIGVSGIQAAQLALLTTEHNVVNASTPGYTRQRTVQLSNLATNTGAGAIGQGVNVQTIERMYDRYLTAQVNNSQTKVSELDTFYSQIKQIDGMLADPDAGLSPALQGFFNGVQQVAANPSLLPARQAMVSSAETLVTRFNDMDTRLGELAEQVNGRITSAVSEVNAFATQIAGINQQIILAQSSFGQPPNDLLDQRDQLVNELNKLIKVSTNTDSSGRFSVFFGSGQQIVAGTQVMEMTATESKADSSKIVVGLKMQSGIQELPDSLIKGGELGGLIAFRTDSLDVVANELGRIAASLTLTFNAQHALGQDLLGNIDSLTTPGFVGEFFKISEPKAIAPDNYAGTGSLSVSFAPPTAPSEPDLSGNFYTDLKASNYEVKFGAAGAFTITRLSDNKLVTPVAGPGPGTVTFDGLELTITTAGGDGDKFLIKPFGETGRSLEIDSQIAADPRLIAAAAPVRSTQSLTNTGSMTISQGVVGVGYDISVLPVTLTAGAANPPSTLSGISGNWTAVYSDGATVPGTGGNINLVNGSGTLARITFSGMSFEIKGAPASNDSFVLAKNVILDSNGLNTGGVQDGRNALLFAKLQTQNTVAGGTATFQAAFSALVADNGIRTREAKIQLDAQGAFLDQAKSTRDSLSAVNLDEEAANMLKFQQAYQASSKILEIGSKLFDTILSIS